MDFETLVLKKEAGIATLTMSRPARLNALTFQMIAEMTQALQEVAKDQSLRVLVLTGTGRAFCAGGDFRGDSGTPAALAVDPQLRRSTVLAQAVRSYTKGIPLALQNLEIPTIAVVNGAAVGGGFSMALACDMRVGSENARFMVAWTLRGLVPAFGDTWLLPRIVGLGKAAELIYTARFVEAEEALKLGILNKLVPAEKLESEGLELAHRVAQGPPLALRLSKLNMYRGLEVDFTTALEYLASSQAQLFLTDDFVEATAAFQQKRQPVFKGK